MAAESQRGVTSHGWRMAVPHRARNSLILDYLRRQEQPQPLDIARTPLNIRRPFSVARAVTPAIPPPTISVPSPQQGRQASFAGLVLPPVSPQVFEPIPQQKDKLDTVIELLSQLASTDKLRNTPAFKYKTRVTNVVGNGPTTQLCGADTERDALMIAPFSTGFTFWVLPDPSVISSTGWGVTDLHPLMLSRESDGLWVYQPWWGSQMLGATAVVIELIRVYQG